MTFKEIKEKMKNARERHDNILNNLDITGGQRGMRNNERAYREAFRLKKEILKLNKQLFNLT